MNTQQTLRAIELAFKLLQNTLVDQDGHLALDDSFVENLDNLLEKFSQTRELVEAMR